MAFSSTLPMRRFARCATPFTPASRPSFIARQVSGRTEPFNENVAQVKRLINRDRKEFLGNADDILDKYTTEFGDAQPSTATPAVGDVNPFASASAAAPAAPAAPATPAAPAAPATPAKPVAPASLDGANPFGKSAAASPFSSASAPAPKPFRSIEPRGLSPDMSPDPIIKETPIDLLKSIGIQQIVVFCTFSSMIGLMIATFYVVLNAGGVRLAGLD